MSRPGPDQDRDDAMGKAYDAKLVRRLWTYVRPHRALVASSLLLLFAVSAVQLVQPYLIKLAIDNHIARRRDFRTGRTTGLRH